MNYVDFFEDTLKILNQGYYIKNNKKIKLKLNRRTMKKSESISS